MRGAIHQVTILTRGVGVPDAWGRAGAVTTSETTVMGRAILTKGVEQEADGKFAEDIYAVATVPPGTQVAAKDQVVLNGVDPTLDGTYEIQYVLYAPMIYECYMRRMGA